MHTVKGCHMFSVDLIMLVPAKDIEVKLWHSAEPMSRLDLYARHTSGGVKTNLMYQESGGLCSERSTERSSKVLFGQKRFRCIYTWWKV